MTGRVDQRDRRRQNDRQGVGFRVPRFGERVPSRVVHALARPRPGPPHPTRPSPARPRRRWRARHPVLHEPGPQRSADHECRHGDHETEQEGQTEVRADRVDRHERGRGGGGTRPCRIESPASAGMPTRMSGTSVRRATRITTGTSSTTPTSKNRGSPKDGGDQRHRPRQPAGADLADDRVHDGVGAARARESAPIIAPSAISRPTLPTVVPNPVGEAGDDVGRRARRRPRPSPRRR